MRDPQPMRLLFAGLAALWLLFGDGGRSHAQDLSSLGGELGDIEATARQLVKSPLKRSQLRSPTYVEERLTDGEMFYRLKDYVRASVILTDIVDNHPQHRAYPDALWLLGDSLFHAGDYLGARSRFSALLERAGESAFKPHVQRALGRLIEIAIRLRDFSDVQAYFDRLARLPPSEVEAATAYYRAKYLYSVAVPEGAAAQSEQEARTDLDKLEQARQGFASVAPGSPYYARARYFVGAIHTRRGEYEQALGAMRQVLDAPATTPEEREVSELAQLAVGRLHYELDQLPEAIRGYQAVSRTSSYFDVALYEIAWVYIRRGDSTRAERALEVLGVAAPDSSFIPDAQLLRGNLLLREGRHDDAYEVFDEVADTFTPVYEQLQELVERHADPAAYFRTLVRSNLEAFDAQAFLPALASRWVRAEGDMDRALDVVADLSQARNLVRETGELVERMSGALNSPNPANLFGDLRSQRERITALRNRLARVRRVLVEAESEQLEGRHPELMSIRQRRRQIESLFGDLPTRGADFRTRDRVTIRRYRALERVLSRLEVQLMGMQARIVATERFLADSRQQAGALPSGAEATQAELELQRKAVRAFQERIDRLRIQVEAGRLQVGVGDRGYAREDALREEYNQLVARERQLAASLGGVGRRTDAMFRRVLSIESMLERHDAKIDEVVQERTSEMRAVLEEERENLVGYRARLRELEAETEQVVGAVTLANFRRVKERFRNLVMRAEVGKTDVAWAEREEHRMRIEMLTRERARELQVLDDEFREIMDEEQQGAEP